MNKEQAIKILDEAVKRLPLTRDDHQILIQCLSYLANLEEKTSEKNEE